MGKRAELLWSTCTLSPNFPSIFSPHLPPVPFPYHTHTLPQRRQSGFKAGGVVVPGLKTGGVFGSWLFGTKNSTDGGT